MNYDSEVDSIIRDSENNYFDLIVSPMYKSVPGEDFVPDEPDYPNACRYMIFSNKTNDLLNIENIELKERVVRKLKNIHGIKDTWD